MSSEDVTVAHLYGARAQHITSEVEGWGEVVRAANFAVMATMFVIGVLGMAYVLDVLP